jgi:hypothetical protein
MGFIMRPDFGLKRRKGSVFPFKPGAQTQGVGWTGCRIGHPPEEIFLTPNLSIPRFSLPIRDSAMA